MRLTKGLLAVSLLLASGTAMAASKPALIWASMVVKGSITITPDGRAASYALDDAKALPPAAADVLSKTIARWRFEPVMRDGKPVRARSVMHVRLLARPLGDGNYAVSVASAYFGKGKSKSDRVVQVRHSVSPHYPGMPSWEGVSATVYVVLRVGRDGKVEKSAVREVDLRTGGTTSEKRHWRQAFAKSSLWAVDQWTFRLPTKGPHVADPYWDVVVPVTYNMRYRHQSHTGPWQGYLPGPRHYIPWLDKHQVAVAGIPADGGAYPVDQRLHLLSAADGGPAPATGAH